MRPLQHPLKPISAKRFEQIIKSAKFECGDGVLIMSGREDHLGFIIEPLKDLQASRAGHHDVEKHQSRPLLVGNRNGSLSVGGLVNFAAAAEIA